MVELRGLGQTLTEGHGGAQPRSRNNTGLIVVSVALFALAGVAGTILAFGKYGTQQTVAAAPQNAPQPASVTPPAASEVIVATAAPVAPDVAPAAAPEVMSDVLAGLSPDERRTTVAEYIANLPTLGIDLPSARPSAPLHLAEVAADEAAATFTASGCVVALDDIATSLTVAFAANAVTAPDADLAPIRNLAGRLADCPSAYMVVAGHADPSGDETQNLVLSWQRAEFVVNALTQAGVESTRLEAIGFGSRRPISEGDAGSDEELNRRVDFVVREALP